MNKASMICALLLATACTAQQDDGNVSDAADSSTVAALMARIDSLVADSTRLAATVDSLTAAAAKRTADSVSAAGRGRIIGYDSAFGPRFVIDSTGKAVPIKPKRP